MADPSSDLHVICPRGPNLDSASVDDLASELTAARRAGAAVVAIDLSAIAGQTPQGVAALLDFAERLAGPGVVLCGLSRLLLATAIDTGLSEHVAIYADAQAVRTALQPRTR